MNARIRSVGRGVLLALLIGAAPLAAADPDCSKGTNELPPAGATNPDPTDVTKTIRSFHQPLYCTEDTAHGWSASHTEFNRTDPNSSTGLNDGFTTANVSDRDPTGHRSMGY